MSSITFDKSLIHQLSDLHTDQEVLSALADSLQQKGFVKDSFKQAVIDRESEFPTGLYTGDINVAIPHADIVNVNEAVIGVGILDKPVDFCTMDDPDKKVPVQLIIMLALTEAHGHIEMLQRVVQLIQDKAAVEKIVSCGCPDDAYQLIKEKLL